MHALRWSRRYFAALAALFAFTFVAAAENEPSTVLAADSARVEAMLANDLAALETLLTDDCLYVHSNGFVQTKREFLTALATGEMRYAAIRYTAPPHVRRYGDSAAVVTGTTQIEVKLADGRVLKPSLLITALYVRQDERWQLASYQSTNAPAAAATK